MPDLDTVTVVSGVPRSGTSLWMQMLAAGGHPVLEDADRPPDADNPRGYFEYTPVKSLRRDASWLERARGCAVKVIHALVPALPPGFDYRIVLVRRDLGEVLASQRVMLVRRGEPEWDLPEARLAAVLRAQLEELEAWVAACPRAELHAVDYAGTLADPAAVARRVDAFLRGGLDVAAMAGVVDPALHRQRVATPPEPSIPVPTGGRSPREPVR